MYEAFHGLPPFRAPALRDLFKAIQEGIQGPAFFESFDLKIPAVSALLVGFPSGRFSAMEVWQSLQRDAPSMPSPKRQRC